MRRLAWRARAADHRRPAGWPRRGLGDRERSPACSAVARCCCSSPTGRSSTTRRSSGGSRSPWRRTTRSSPTCSPPHGGRLVLASLLATGAFLTRGSIGLGPVVALDLRRGHERRLRPCDGEIAPVSPGWRAWARPRSCPSSLYCYVNYAKFGTLFSIPVDKQFQVAGRPEPSRSPARERRQALPPRLRADDASSSTPARTPSTSSGSCRGSRSRRSRAKVVGDVRFDLLDRASSVPASMPAVALLAAVGTRRGRPAATRAAPPCRLPRRR